MSNLSPSDIAAYRELVRHPDVTAMAMCAAIDAGNAPPVLDASSDEVVHGLWLRLSALEFERAAEGLEVSPLHSEAREMADQERIRRGLPGVRPDREAPFMTLVGELYHLLGVAYETLHRGDVDGALSQARDVEQRVPDTDETSSPEIRHDVAKLHYEIGEIRAKACASGADASATHHAYRHAIECAATLDALAERPEQQGRIVLGYCEWMARAVPDEMLLVALPLARDYLGAEPTSLGVSLRRLLMQFHADLNDPVAAVDASRLLEQDLAELGYEDSRSGDYVDVLPTWLAVARVSDTRHAERIRWLSDVIVSYVSINAVAAKRPGEAGAEGTQRMEALSELYFELRAIETDVHEEDGRLIEQDRLGSEGRDLGLPPYPAPPDGSARAAFTRAVAPFDKGDRAPGTLDALRAVARDVGSTASFRATAHLKLALGAWEADDPAEAFVELDAAAALGRRSGRLDIDVETLHLRAIFLAEQEDWERASALCGEAIARVEAARDRINAPYAASAYLADKFNPYLLGVNAARKIGREDVMLERAELLKARELAAPTLAPAALKAAFAQRLRALMDAALDPDAGDEARELARGQRRLLWSEFQIRRATRATRFRLGALQSIIAGRALVLDYLFLGENVLLLVVLDGRQVITHRVEIPPSGSLFDAVDRVSRASWQMPSLERDLRTLAEVLIPETLGEAIESAPQLIVCLHQTLHPIPFAALPWRGQPLVHHLPVGTVPNLTCLTHAPVAHTGDGSLATIAARHGRADGGAPLPELPNAVAEAEAIARGWAESGAPTLPLHEAGATRRNLFDADTLAGLSRARYLHIGVHGSDVADADAVDNPMEVQLFLHDGPIDGLDIGALALDCDLVVLAACFAAKRATSARGLARLPADTVYGLQAAFREAGARAVVAPLWPANDGATPAFTGALSVALRGGHTPAEAFRLAMRRYWEGANLIEREVGFWGCFTLIAFGGQAFGLDASAR